MHDKFKSISIIINILFISILFYNTKLYANAKKIKIITTFNIIQDITQNITGNVAIVKSIVKPGAEIHGYQPTPKDILKINDADLILWNGLGLESWFQRFFFHYTHIPKVIVTKGIKPIPINKGKYKNNPNPHAWMSTRNALIYIKNIQNALIKYDYKNIKIYNKNTNIYIQKINKIDLLLRKRLSKIPLKKRWLITSEGAFSYLAKDYGFKEAYLWPINAEEQSLPQQIRKVIDIIRKYDIPVIFSESTVSDIPVKQITKETNAKYGNVLYVDSLSASNGPVPTYIELLKTTINTIAQGFNQ